MTKIKHPSAMSEEEFRAYLEEDPAHIEKAEDGEYQHVPIAFLEPDLRYTFDGKIEIVVKGYREMFGAIMLHVRLKVFHPVHKIWLKFDGMAASNIEGIEAGEWKGTTKSRLLDDMRTGVPACYSVAIQNAAKKIGKRFGSDVNRTSKPGEPKETPEVTKKKKVDDRILSLIDDCETTEELNKLLPQLPNGEEVQQALNKKLLSLKNKIKK